jgi:methylated-DNA-[protein]-cysteine S-methyltransferase
MKLYYDTFPIPLGKFSVAVNESGAVVATAFGDDKALRKLLDTSEWIHSPRAVAAARSEIKEFFRGERRKFTVKVDPSGTAFQKSVWSALLRIPFGETRSYGQLAAEVGNRRAARAVGRANATNPVCLLIPCHRCIGADGSLTGFAYGEKLKSRLLAHENPAEK